MPEKPLSLETKYQPSVEFTKAMDTLAEVSPDGGESRPDWHKTPVFNVLSRAKEWGGKAIKHPVTWLMAVTFGFNPAFHDQVRERQGFLIDTVSKLNNGIGNLPLGQEFLHALQDFSTGPFPFNTSALIGPDNLPLVNFTLAVGDGIKVSLVPVIVGYVGIEKFRAARRNERMKQGIEPLRRDEIPQNLMIGPAEFLSTIAQTVLPERKDFKHPDVIVHADGILPAAFGNEVEYHFDITASPNKITDKGFIKESGIDRADNLILVAFDPDNALYYGRQASSKITPSALSTLVAFLSQQPREKLQGKKILAVVPGQSTFLASTTQQHELFEMFRAKGANIEVITPEEVFLNQAKEDIEFAVKGKKEGEKAHICLVGGADTEMLLRFKKGLKSTDGRVMVDIISDEILGDTDLRNLTPGERTTLSDEKRTEIVEQLLAQSDINYVYGDNDSQTTDLANLIIEKRKAERKQTICLLEREESVVDARAFGLFNICLYRELAKAIGQRMTK